ncbi:hypothetical protein F8M41_024967 [Gigaspora margarita]|uniref:Uncharacterized protein n=1 Tax=Gigaspora margarita TaxID=4874 RepID=A0A8H3XL61_GIGMA|nr:hypothetical protein F8M41_024967 [Gigaspora margarita]
MAFSLAAKFSINFVASRWLYEKYQDRDLGAQPLVNLSAVFLSKPSEEPSIPTTILQNNNSTDLFSVSQIAHKAINIAIEMNDPNVFRFLKEYITRKGHSLVENTTSIYTLKEHSKSNILETSPIVENTTSINILKEISSLISLKPYPSESLILSKKLEEVDHQKRLIINHH